MKYAETFNAPVSGKPSVFLGKNLGVTAQGHVIFPAQQRVDNKIIAEGKVMYFRGNSVDDIDFAGKVGEDGFAEATNVGITGAWLWLSGKNTIDTTGYALTAK